MDAGKLIIGTEIDNTKLEKQLAQLEKQQGKLKDQKLKLDLDNTKALNNLQKIDNELEIINQKIATLEENNTPENLAINLDYQELINQREQLTGKGNEYLQQLDMIKSKQNDINESMKANETSIEIINNQLNNMPINLDNISSKLSKVVKKVTKWTLALFGIRTAYTFIRQMINQATQQNEELANKLQYIKFAISTIFEPIAKFVVDIIYNIIAGLGTIIKLITGINIFSKATAKNFKKANKSAGGLKKTLAGFDEVNVLSNGGGGSGGLANGLVPDLSEKIEKMAEKVKDIFRKLIYFIENDFLGKLRTLFGPIGDILYIPFLYGYTYIKTLISEIYKGIKNVVEGIIKIFKGDFVGGLKQIFSGILTIVTAPFKALKSAVEAVWNQIIDSFNYWKSDMVKLINGIWNKIATPIKNLINKIKKALGFKVEMEFNTSYGGGGKGSSGSGGSGGGRAKGGIYYPKLASGGIINQPGRGVPYHGATIGERGAEAVLPLTDSQQMALLGEAIGKYITINATIPVYAYNRQVDRQIRVIKANDDFAYNR